MSLIPFFLLLSLLCISDGAPQNLASPSSGLPPRERLVHLIHNPPPSRDFSVLDKSIISEFLKDDHLVTELVNCFDLQLECRYEGINYLIEEMSTLFSRDGSCVSCPKEFTDVINFARSEFEKRQKREWLRLLGLIPDFLGK